MKRFLILLSAFLLVLGLSGVACAYSINYSYSLEADGNSYTSPYSGVTIESFDPGGSYNWYWYGDSDKNAAILNYSTGTAAAPFGKTYADNTYYISVPENLTEGDWVAVDFDLGADYNYFGLWWGSVDTYNTLEFYNNGILVQAITGSQALSPSAANGNQTAPATNLYVNFIDLPLFDSFAMVSTNYAFEADNIAVGNVYVPEPSTILLLGLGLLGLAGVRRKIKK